MSGVFVGASIVAAIVAAEVALRAVAPRIAKPRDWQTWQAQHKAAAAEALARTGGASVVTVGASNTNCDVDPERLTNLLGVERPVFSAGLNGASARTMELWTLDVMLPLLRPDLVVVGLHTFEMNDNSVGGRMSFQKLKRSFGWRRLQPHPSPARRVFLWVEQRSFLVRYRRFLFEPAIGRRANPMRHRYQRFRTDPLHLFRKTRGAVDSVSRLGVPEVLKDFQQWPYSTRGTGIRKIWAEQYLNDYDVGGTELAAVRRLVDGVRAAGSALLVVLMPATEDWADLHPRGVGDVERFRSVLDALVTERGLAFFDPSPDFGSHDLFVDPVHLNAAGTKRLADVLADPIADILRRGGRPTASTPPAGAGSTSLPAES